jgi:hypothetical protein
MRVSRTIYFPAGRALYRHVEVGRHNVDALVYGLPGHLGDPNEDTREEGYTEGKEDTEEEDTEEEEEEEEAVRARPRSSA